jgi:hypothetical protein
MAQLVERGSNTFRCTAHGPGFDPQLDHLFFACAWSSSLKPVIKTLKVGENQIPHFKVVVACTKSSGGSKVNNPFTIAFPSCDHNLFFSTAPSPLLRADWALSLSYFLPPFGGIQIICGCLLLHSLSVWHTP